MVLQLVSLILYSIWTLSYCILKLFAIHIHLQSAQLHLLVWKTSSWDEHLCRTRLFPVTTKRANGIQEQSALLYPFHNTKTESVTNDNSKITTPSINLNFQRELHSNQTIPFLQ